MTYRGEIKNLREKVNEQGKVVDLPIKRKVNVTHRNWSVWYLNGALILSLILLGFLISRDLIH